MLEHNPVLRERVLGVTAVSAILIGGALGFDTMLTSGWQIGADGDAHATYAGATPQQYFDDVSRNWTIAPPQRVELASADMNASTSAVTPVVENLDGASAAGASLIPTAPALAPAPAAAAPQTSADQALAAQSQAADQRFDAIESDIQQANSQIEHNEPGKDAEPATASDTQG